MAKLLQFLEEEWKLLDGNRLGLIAWTAILWVVGVIVKAWKGFSWLFLDGDEAIRRDIEKVRQERSNIRSEFAQRGKYAHTAMDQFTRQGPPVELHHQSRQGQMSYRQ